MKNNQFINQPKVDELLLGGAAMSAYDLAIIEEREIQWFLLKETTGSIELLAA